MTNELNDTIVFFLEASNANWDVRVVKEAVSNTAAVKARGFESLSQYFFFGFGLGLGLGLSGCAAAGCLCGRTYVPV
jgi:hypothetical protein